MSQQNFVILLTLLDRQINIQISLLPPPPPSSPDSVLRFGNHDRLPNPDDCQKFFSCLKTGLPRLSACPKDTVFNNATGHCSDPERVPGWSVWTFILKKKCIAKQARRLLIPLYSFCTYSETYWKDREAAEYDSEYYDG